jgi:hypothetical protein
VRSIWILILACAAAAGGPATAQEWARKMFRETSHDFGTLAAGAKAEHRFVLTNLFQETVHIVNVSSSCGCTTPIVSKHTLRSRESAEIIAVYNTTKYKGEKTAVLTVTFDQPFAAQVQLRIAGFIRSDVVFNPGVINFGLVRLGTPSERSVDILYAGRNEWEIVDVTTANPHLEAELLEKRRGGGQVEYRMILRLRGDAPLGYVRDQVTIVTNDGQLARIPLDLEGKVESEVTVTPLPLVFGTVRPGEKVTKKIVVRGTRPFRITRVECPDCFEVAAPEDSKTFHLVPVTFIGTKSGNVVSKIHIETDLGANVVPEIPAYAEISE